MKSAFEICLFLDFLSTADKGLQPLQGTDIHTSKRRFKSRQGTSILFPAVYGNFLLIGDYTCYSVF
jgi:hypothetical protein